MNLRELLALAFSRPAAQPAPADGFNADRPWDSAVMQAPPVEAAAVAPQQQAAPPVDPFTYAQQLEERQRAAAQLSAPATPVLSLLDIIKMAKAK